MRKSLLFITTSSLTMNPRLLKEVELAYEQNCKITIVCIKYSNKLEELDQIWLRKFPKIKTFRISVMRKSFFSWLWSSLLERFYRFLHKKGFESTKILAYASSKRSYLVLKHASKFKSYYDYIIAHNMSALYPAYELSRRWKIPFGFDMEDYYPGEEVKEGTKQESSRRIELLKKLYVYSDYASFASPLFDKECLKNNIELPEKSIQIANSFPQKLFEQDAKIDLDQSKLNFVWFSQTISYRRGLEQFIPVLMKFRERVNLHLIGNLHQPFHKEFIAKNKDFIKVHSIMPPDQLNGLLRHFDVGLAIEPGKDLNNTLAVSNKIYSYAQAGIYVLATDTLGQTAFIKDYPWTGRAISLDSDEIEKTLLNLLSKKESIRDEQDMRREKSINLAWEKEKSKLWEFWSERFKNPSTNSFDKSLKILITVDPEIPVPPLQYGGIERICDGLISEYAALGHEVVLLSNEKSTAKDAHLKFGWRGKKSRGVFNGILNALQVYHVIRKTNPDVVHSFSRLLYLWPSLLLTNKHFVMTYQREISNRTTKYTNMLGKNNIWFTACGYHIIENLDIQEKFKPIYNFTDVDYFTDDPKVEKTHLMFLGRIQDIKGTWECIEVAKRTNIPLIIAGNVQEDHLDYFEEKIKPFIDQKLIQYVGPVNDEQKRKYLRMCKAFLFPIKWEEPFGIVMAEAMACGTPVVAFNRGSVAEVVEDGKNGFAVENLDQMTEVMDRIEELDRNEVQKECKEKFSKENIAQNYLTLFHKILTHSN